MHNGFEDTILPALASGSLAALVHELFGTGPLVLAVALLGAWFGLAALPATSPCSDWFETLKRFVGNLILISGATISAGFVVSLFLVKFPTWQYPIAFFGAMLIVYHHKKLLTLSGKIIDKKAGEV